MIKTNKFLLVIGALLLCGYVKAQEMYTLEQVLDIAYKNSPNIKLQELSLEKSSESLKAQKAALKSKFALDVYPIAYSKNRGFSDVVQKWQTTTELSSSGTFSITQPIAATDGTISLTDKFGFQNNSSDETDPTNTFSNNVQLTLNQPIFTYNSTKLELQGLELDLENTMLSYEIEKLSMEKSVSQYFYNVYQAQSSLLIANEEKDNQKKSCEIIKNKVDAGLSAEEELWQAELNLASSESSVYNAEVSLENAKDQLKLAIGMPIDKDINVVANVEVKTVDVKLEEAIDYALKQRMELRQKEISIENAKSSLIKTSATNEFSGNIALSVGLFGDNENATKIYDSPTDNENISLSFQIPIWDWGQRKSLIKAAEASVKTQEINYDQEKVDIVVNVRQVYRSLKNYINQINIQKKSVENAQKTYELKLEEYQNGDLTSMDLSLYQSQLSSAKNDLTSALIDYKLELLNLKIQTLWNFETNKPVLTKDINSIK
jgi:outer membrane protein